MTARVFTIPPSAPFLPTLIEALASGKLGFAATGDPLALARVTLFLPTRRACRLARDAFLDGLPADAAILPRIVPIGDIDEDEIAFAESASGELATEALALPEALGGLERRLLLARLVGQWAAAPELRAAAGVPLVAQTPAAACALADDLARLIDDMTMRGVSWDRLDELVPEEFDDYWQLTLKFLHIAREKWPEILKERGCIEAAERRDRLIKAEAKRLGHNKDAPVIAAGSTGSIPATAELLATIARLPHGAVVLPGLDTQLDEDSWRLLGGDDAKGVAPAPGHPQFALHALLSRIGIGRDAVADLAKPCGRERLVSEALRPAAATDHWRQSAADADFAAHAQAALATLAMIEAANAEDEALAIAVALREAVAEGKTAALVTPDRALGRRVLAALGRWTIAVEESGGDALADTPAGIFARLAAAAALGGLPPVTLLALLKHPLCRLGRGNRDKAIAALERAVLRGPRPRAGSGGLMRALAAFDPEKLHPSDPRAHLRSNELAAAVQLVRALGEALAPLESIAAAAPHALSEFAARHREVLAALSRGGSGEAAFAGPDGTKLAAALDELATSPAAAGLAVEPRDYAELFGAALAGRVVRRPAKPGFLRVRILGPLEARLTESDRIVLGGLVEGTWPPESHNDAWLSRPMRLSLGLDLPERRIGLSAHDFAQLLGAREVFLTRAAKIAGAPTNPSRFVQRLAAVAGERWPSVVARGDVYLQWARALDRPDKVTPAPQPAPKPPRAARPKGLSVTDIEHWLRDPYTIYAKHILRLRPIDPVDADPGAAERGTFVHAAIAAFTRQFAKALPADPAGELIALGRAHFAALENFPEARAFWWPRFERIAHWFARWELERRAGIAGIEAEIRGEIDIALNEGAFELRGIADRIERDGAGRYIILDYKTGSARTEPQVRTGLAPQLTLEAAILRSGGFKEIPAGSSVAEIVYVTLKGGEPPGDEKSIAFKDGTPDSHADRALARLAGLARRFYDDEAPYRSLVHPMWTYRYGEYDHLARVREWAASGGVIDDAPGAPGSGGGA